MKKGKGKMYILVRRQQNEAMVPRMSKKRELEILHGVLDEVKVKDSRHYTAITLVSFYSICQHCTYTRRPITEIIGSST